MRMKRDNLDHPVFRHFIISNNNINQNAFALALLIIIYYNIANHLKRVI